MSSSISSVDERSALMPVNSVNQPDLVFGDDIQVQRHRVGRAAWPQVMFTIINGFVGGGLLGLPYGFMNGGIVASPIAVVVLAVIALYTLNLLAEMKMEYTGKVCESYADLGEAAFGKPGRIITQLFVALSQLGYAAAYLVFILDNISTLNFFRTWINYWIAAAMCLPIMIVLVFVRDIKFLGPTSIGAFVAVVISVVVVIQYGASHDPIEKAEDYKFFDPPGMAVLFGIIAFAYVQHGLILNQHATLKNPRDFRKALGLSVFVTTIIYLVFGVFGYLFFKSETQAVITKNLGKDLEADIVKLGLSAVLVFAFPLQIFPVSQMLEEGIFGPRVDGVGEKLQPTLSADTFMRNGLRFLLVAAAFGAAKGIPLFGLFSSLVGCLSNSVIAFVFPPLFYVRLFYWRHTGPKWTRLALWKVVLNLLLCVFGVASVAISSSIVMDDIICHLAKKGVCSA